MVAITPGSLKPLPPLLGVIETENWREFTTRPLSSCTGRVFSRKLGVPLTASFVWNVCSASSTLGVIRRTTCDTCQSMISEHGGVVRLPEYVQNAFFTSAVRSLGCAV